MTSTTALEKATATFVRNIEDLSGRKLAEWIALARGSGFAKHGEIMGWLKAQHGLSHSHANFLAKEAMKTDGASENDLVAVQFSGPKAALKPLYDQLITLLQSLGKDVEIAPKKNNVSIRRSKQFALLQASTATRLDVGLILKGVEPEGRLEPSGSFNAMFTHRVRIGAKNEINGELKAWLKKAYELA